MIVWIEASTAVEISCGREVLLVLRVGLPLSELFALTLVVVILVALLMRVGFIGGVVVTDVQRSYHLPSQQVLLYYG